MNRLGVPTCDGNKRAPERAHSWLYLMMGKWRGWWICTDCGRRSQRRSRATVNEPNEASGS